MILTDGQRTVLREYVLYQVRQYSPVEANDVINAMLDFFSRDEGQQTQCLMDHASHMKHRLQQEREALATQQLTHLDAQIAFYDSQCGGSDEE